MSWGGVGSGRTQHAAGNSSEHRALNPDTAGDLADELWQGDVMGAWIVLLRGVNVGGANKLAMADLRALVTELGVVVLTTLGLCLQSPS